MVLPRGCATGKYFTLFQCTVCFYLLRNLYVLMLYLYLRVCLWFAVPGTIPLPKRKVFVDDATKKRLDASCEYTLRIQVTVRFMYCRTKWLMFPSSFIGYSYIKSVINISSVVIYLFNIPCAVTCVVCIHIYVCVLQLHRTPTYANARYAA